MMTNCISVAKIRSQLTVCVKIQSMLKLFRRPLSSDKDSMRPKCCALRTFPTFLKFVMDVRPVPPESSNALHFKCCKR